jgi:hypothetical protein
MSALFELLQQSKHSNSVCRSHIHFAIGDHRRDELVSRAELISSRRLYRSCTIHANPRPEHLPAKEERTGYPVLNTRLELRSRISLGR